MRRDGDSGHLCKVCGAGGLRVFYTVKGVPAQSVLLLPTREAALSCPRGDLTLGFCPSCSFIANLALEPALVRHSGDYESTQIFSPSFDSFSQHLAALLVSRLDLRKKTVVEIGCGNGEFLSMLCEMGGNRGIGFDPAFEPARAARAPNLHIEFVKDLYSPSLVEGAGDLIVCKMTLEHIAEPGPFLALLREAAGRSGRTDIFVQVPDATRILRDLAFYDIYYEHCSYFSPLSLTRLFGRHGFTVTELWSGFGGQYLMLLARPAEERSAETRERGREAGGLERAVGRFALNVAGAVGTWAHRIGSAASAGRKTVIWGGGSKGVAFLTALPNPEAVEYVVDVNPNKGGTFMPGTGQRIVSPAFLKEYNPHTVIVMNHLYRQEIADMLRTMGLAPAIAAL